MHSLSQLRKNFSHALSCLTGFLRFLHFFCKSYISRIFSGKCKLSQPKRIGTVRGCLSGWDQLICGGYGIVDLGYYLQHQVFRKLTHCRPVFDVRAEFDLYGWICHTLAVKYAVLINTAVEEIFWFSELSIDVRGRCEIALVCCCRRDGTCIHQRYGSDLSALEFGAFAVREVSGRVADTECIICRCISCTEARTAKCRFYDCSALDQGSEAPIFCQLHIDRRTCRINTQGKLIGTNKFIFQNICCVTNIFKSTAGTSGNDTLINIQPAIAHFIFQSKIYCAVKAYCSTFFYIIKDIHQVFIQLFNGIRITWVERHGDHRLHCAQIHFYHSVIICYITRV